MALYREQDLKGGSHTRRTPDPDFPAVGFNNFMGQSETQAKSLVLGGKIRIEDLIRIIPVKAGAGIGDGNDCHMIFF